MTQRTLPQLLVAATSSGCGKTTFTLGLLRALRRRGMELASFKAGPDYIDPKFHELSSGQPSINLDLYMMSREHIHEVYARHSAEARATVVEGVMGLFDGHTRMEGSPAELAALLNIPVVLLVNAASSAYSVGAIIHGFATWKPEVRVAGVVFNRVASQTHYKYLCDAAEDSGVPVLGYIPRTTSLDVPSRHLGLSLEELKRLDAFPDAVADLIEQHVDLDRLLQLCSVPAPSAPALTATPRPQIDKPLSIAVARDDAFNFIYPENIRALEALGSVRYFSPMSDPALPEGCDLVYLPGGYPEFYLPELRANEGMRLSIRQYVEADGRLLAECGGMMYLCQQIEDEDGTAYPMCGVLDGTATMQGKKLSLGYRTVESPTGKWRGHEFHYSHLSTPASYPSIAQQYNVRGGAVDTALYRYRNAIAGYTHLYWAEQDILQLWG